MARENVANLKVIDDEKVSPFHCGSQFKDFKFNNCTECSKGYTDEKFNCDLEYALDYASMTDGKVDKEIAERLGYFDNPVNALVWRCREFEEKKK